MAVSLNGSRRGSRRNLICGICQDVYRSPRFLPCHHSFCLECLEGLVRARRGRPFPCPVCRKTIKVPLAGASGFQTNFYFEEEELEQARKEPGTGTCRAHSTEPLVFFCVQCDQAICIRCKLTKHDRHDTEDLSEAAARCQDRMKRTKDRLESITSTLIKKSEEAHNNRKAARKKGKLLEKQVQVQYDILATKLSKWRDSVLNGIKELNVSVDKKLSTTAHKLQKELDSLLLLQQRVHRALGDISDVEVVQEDRELHGEQGAWKKLEEVENRMPVTTVRSGLHCHPSAVTDDDIHRFLGSPVELSLPCRAVSETVVPIYQCGEEGACREVHSVCHVNDQQIYISFGGTLPDYAGEDQIKITDKGDKKSWCDTKPEYKNKKASFVKYTSPQTKDTFFNAATKCGLFAKNGVLIVSKQLDSKTTKFSKVTVTSDKPLQTTRQVLFSVHSQNTVAFDATSDEQLFAIVEKKTTRQLPVGAEYNVLLFNRGQSEPFTTYRPPDAGFLPTDVCFWQEDGRQKLLVADAHNDSVHVVIVERDACHFERYLAAGNGHLVRPTALNVDDSNRVWIGCANGWILRCEKLQVSNVLPDVVDYGFEEEVDVERVSDDDSEEEEDDEEEYEEEEEEEEDDEDEEEDEDDDLYS